MEHGGMGLEDAARAVIHERLAEGDGGMIGVSAAGELVMVFNSPGMFRGVADAKGRFDVGIWEDMRAGSAPAPSSAP